MNASSRNGRTLNSAQAKWEKKKQGWVEKSKKIERTFDQEGI